MVMEAPPSPQSVGREFVRQYYTLLNKAPTHLHRFYNNQSSFVHGGLDPPNRDVSPVIGQKQIHQKIQQLNFRDCHAKITQVDAQATLGSGVVVQVTGELSNAGQPMRRFTQTFVLAAQSPKKYYVHNDIFRYQDEIVSDDECEPESRSEIEDELQERPVLTEPLAQPPIPYYNPAAAAPLQPSLPPVVVPAHLPAVPPAHVLPAQPVAAINGGLHPDDINLVAQVAPVPTQAIVVPMASLQLNPDNALHEEVLPIEETAPVDVVAIDNYSIGQDMNNQELNQDAVLSNEPKTYATLLKSGGNYSNLPAQNVYNNPPPPKPLSPPPSQSHYDMSQTGGAGNQQVPMGARMSMGRPPPRNASNQQQQQPPRVPRQDSSRNKNSFGEDGGLVGYEDRRKSQGHRDNSFGDSHQLFLGNLPHSATEDELRDIFSAFGPIVDLRIQPSTKGNQSGPRAPPNYGFITYENQQAVQSCLAAKPIRYPQNDKNGTVLNVEEKKAKDRLPYNRDSMGGGPRRDNNGPRRPNTARGGPGGPMGGGPGGGPMGGGPGGRPNNFNRPPPNRTNNTYNNRR